jgi:hypothetical protein
MLIAVYGTDALQTLTPTFAVHSGLLGRRAAQGVAGQYDCR